MADGALRIEPVTPARWADLEELFRRPGPRGAAPVTAKCWCMFWRLEPAEYNANFGRPPLNTDTESAANRRLMAKIVERGPAPGLIAYLDGAPVGWVGVGPREWYPRLERSPRLKPEDDKPAWSINCFYVHRSAWRRGVAEALLDAALDHARSQGATRVEGYPVKPGNIDPYTGYEEMFAKRGFRPARPGQGKGRSLWRRTLRPSS
jgi:GNAT superfamily N-acetyltransferase